MNSPGAYTAYGKKRCAETEGQDESVQLQSTLPSVRIRQEGNVVEGSLAVTYFRTRMCTIIGATSFHGPVRDGKGWVQSAMAAKRNLYHGVW